MASHGITSSLILPAKFSSKAPYNFGSKPNFSITSPLLGKSQNRVSSAASIRAMGSSASSQKPGSTQAPQQVFSRTHGYKHLVQLALETLPHGFLPGDAW
ncbi:hypothetical protein RJ639_012449 [Escallonia herrerae]|uniref:Uncharacterized protein n=1 Tax=Escallonia herrerae TaxID=1293975 RepID=A0AA88VPB5_9ASTE|nr:hypothetical protein RJ639_012449 [Escallonia herrerae]